MPWGFDPTPRVQSATADLEVMACAHDVFAGAVAIDSFQWRLLTVIFADAHRSDALGEQFQILHTSTPHLSEIADTPQQ